MRAYSWPSSVTTRIRSSGSSSSLSLFSSTVVEMNQIWLWIKKSLTMPFAWILFWRTPLRDGDAHTLGQERLPHGLKGGLRKVKPGKCDCIGMSDSWSVKVRLVYASPTGAVLFGRFGHWNRVDLCLFHLWGFRRLVGYSLVLPLRAYCHGCPYSTRFPFWDPWNN